MKKLLIKLQEKMIRCPICSSKDIGYNFRTTDSFEGHANFDVYKCNNCSVYFLNPQPTTESLKEYYEAGSHAIHLYTEDNINKFIKAYEEKYKRDYKNEHLDVIKHYIKTGNVLDMGCGRGEFVKLLQEYNYNAYGVDNNQKNVDLGKSYNINNLFINNAEDIDFNIKFDLITLISFLEHTFKPRNIIEKCDKLLKDNGLLYISIPTTDSLHFNIMRKESYWIMAPYHLFYFNYKSLEKLLNNYKFKIKNFIITPYTTGGWTHSISNELGLKDKYLEWEKDSDFMKYTKHINNIFDSIAYMLKQPSIMKIIAVKNSD